VDYPFFHFLKISSRVVDCFGFLVSRARRSGTLQKKNEPALGHELGFELA
jgi:hypothetical protein